MSRPPSHLISPASVMAAALLVLALCGCQNNRAAVIPPPGGILSQGDSYYNRPAAATAGSTAAPAGGAAVNLSPGGLPKLPPPPVSSESSANHRTPRDTYDVTTRVAADNQPIRVLDSTASPASSLAGAPRGMTLNDGTTARSWQTSPGLPASVAANPFGSLRGGSSSSTSLPQGFSGQDGQWRSRSSYEGTERR